MNYGYSFFYKAVSFACDEEFKNLKDLAVVFRLATHGDEKSWNKFIKKD